MDIVVQSYASWVLWDLRVLPRGNVFKGRNSSCIGTRDVICDIISLGNGPVLPYPLAGFPTHPRKTLGAIACGRYQGESSSREYHGLTSMWCFASKCLVK